MIEINSNFTIIVFYRSVASCLVVYSDFVLKNFKLEKRGITRACVYAP